MDFPNEDEPDGNRFLPHHYLHGAWALVLIALIHDATFVLVPIVVSLFGWYHVWFHYHAFGASLTLVGLSAALGGAIISPALSPTMKLLAGVAFLWALDDAYEHATGVWTPLDWLWNNHLRKYVKRLD